MARNRHFCEYTNQKPMKKYFVFAIALGAIAVSCQTEPENTDPVDTETSTEDTTAQVVEDPKPQIPEDRKFNDLANFLAGVEGDDASTLKSLESSATWQSYQGSVDQIWAKTNAKLPVMKDWAAAEMKDANAVSYTHLTLPTTSRV